MRVRCVLTTNRGNCRCWWPCGENPRISRDFSVCEMLGTGRGSETRGGAFGSFEVRSGRGICKPVARGASVYMPGPPGRIRQRQLPQRNLGNLEDYQQRGRNGTSLGRIGEVMSKQATEEGWSRWKA